MFVQLGIMPYLDYFRLSRRTLWFFSWIFWILGRIQSSCLTTHFKIAPIKVARDPITTPIFIDVRSTSQITGNISTINDTKNTFFRLKSPIWRFEALIVNFESYLPNDIEGLFLRYFNECLSFVIKILFQFKPRNLTGPGYLLIFNRKIFFKYIRDHYIVCKLIRAIERISEINQQHKPSSPIFLDYEWFFYKYRLFHFWKILNVLGSQTSHLLNSNIF